jgi:hypothetical protein
MLQPRTYPELVGKALVLEAEPFLTMAEDDNPWVEGLFLVTCVGVLLGGAHLIGGLLWTASMPPADAAREALLPIVQQFATRVGMGLDPVRVEESFRQLWTWGAGFAGYQGGLARLFFALAEPVWLVLQWFMLAVVTHFAARLLGGTGRLVQTLGTTALAAAPYVLGVLTIVPFVSVSALLLAVWSLLIVYRAVEVTHDLSWQRSALAVLAVPLVAIVIGFFVAAVTTVLFTIGGAA